jgi:hypothetical protein
MFFKYALKRTLTPVIFSIILSSISSEIVAQNVSPQRHIQIEPLNKYAPVKVAAVVHHGVSYQNPLGPHQEITLTDGDPSWFANVSLAILNQSSKPITAIEIQFDVPAWRTSSTEPKKLSLLCLGKLPDNAPRYGSEGQPENESQAQIDIRPGTQLTLPLARAFPLLKDYPLRTTEIEAVDSIWVRIRRVFFEDKTMWVTNSYLKPDKSQPGAYVRVSREEFESKQ